MAQVKFSPIESLPPELLSQVFPLLSEECHTETANCRLVCRKWRELSSPFLATTVVIADRMSALQKLRETLDCPYWSRHVTTLIWDASAYKPSLAKRYNTYRLRATIPRPVPNDLQHRLEQQSRSENIKSLLAGIPDPRVLAAQPESSSKFVDDASSDPPSVAVQGDMDPSTDAIHRGFTDYRSRYRDQCELHRRRLSLRYLHLAFQRFPKLRHFQFGDFRSLARRGETFPELCTRLFGSTMPPSLLTAKPSRYSSAYRQDLYQCMRNLLIISPRLESFTLGHGFLDIRDTKPKTVLSLVRINKDYVPNDAKAWRRVLASVKRLSLHVTLVPKTKQQDRSKIPKSISKFLSHTEASLRHLELSTKPWSEHDALRRIPGRAYTELPITAFKVILSLRRFQKLTSVVFDGWFFSPVELEKFLLAHKTTLRELHLLNCCFRDTTQKAMTDSFEHKLPSVMSLTGAELYNVAFEEDANAGHSWQECIELETVTDSHDLPVFQEYVESQVITDAPLETQVSKRYYYVPFGLEEALLGGRANCLSSRLRVPRSRPQTVFTEGEDGDGPVQPETIGRDFPHPPSDTSSEETVGPDTESQGTGRHRKRRARFMSFVRQRSLLCFK